MLVYFFLFEVMVHTHLTNLLTLQLFEEGVDTFVKRGQVSYSPGRTSLLLQRRQAPGLPQEPPAALRLVHVRRVPPAPLSEGRSPVSWCHCEAHATAGSLCCVHTQRLLCFIMAVYHLYNALNIFP